MKVFVKQYGITIVYFILVTTFLALFFSLMNTDLTRVFPSFFHNNVGTNHELANNPKPILTVESEVIPLNSTFDPLDYVQAVDGEGMIINENIIVYGNVDVTQKGAYSIRYTVRDQYGLFAEKSVVFIVD